jgi:hypothetical protein
MHPAVLVVVLDPSSRHHHSGNMLVWS